VGDWGIATWWGRGPLPAPPYPPGDDDRWAARIGWVCRDGLWQMDVLSK